ncbi:MAG: hypothetical protein ACFB4J_13640 [Elainellaceae cyanobacterium]
MGYASANPTYGFCGDRQHIAAPSAPNSGGTQAEASILDVTSSKYFLPKIRLPQNWGLGGFFEQCSIKEIH